MRVHHLNAGLMSVPVVGRLVCHTFAVEYADRVVLVDSGFGLADHENPWRAGAMARFSQFAKRPDLTAIRQLESRGIDADRVSDVVLTHLDFDHAGGLSDFPQATVHTTAAEHAAAITSPDWYDRVRYQAAAWAHGPRWQLHAGRGDMTDLGLAGHEILPGITICPMPGHSRGHAVVAVEADGHTYIHAGDAAFDGSSIGARTPDSHELAVRRPLRSMERMIGRDQAAIARNHEQLAALNAREEITVVPAHDVRVFERLSGQQA